MSKNIFYGRERKLRIFGRFPTPSLYPYHIGSWCYSDEGIEVFAKIIRHVNFNKKELQWISLSKGEALKIDTIQKEKQSGKPS